MSHAVGAAEKVRHRKGTPKKRYTAQKVRATPMAAVGGEEGIPPLCHYWNCHHSPASDAVPQQRRLLG